MDKREQLLEKVDKEFKTFLDDLEQYDVENIIDNAEYIAKMKTVHDYIKKDYIIKEDQIDYFLKLDKPLDAICDWYEPNEVEIINDLEHVIWEIEDKGLYMYDEQEDFEGMTMQ